jgi:hypothetical protein
MRTPFRRREAGGLINRTVTVRTIADFRHPRTGITALLLSTICKLRAGDGLLFPLKVGEVWENPVKGERSVILERPWDNPASRVTGKLTALVGARVMGEHRHSALVEQFTVLEGALSILRFGGRDGIRTHDLLIANEEKSKLRCGITIT